MSSMIGAAGINKKISRKNRLEKNGPSMFLNQTYQIAMNVFDVKKLMNKNLILNILYAQQLDNLSKQNPKHADIIAFNEAGTSFIVKNQERLSHEILPVFFKHQNFSSFIRQLNMYGFKKIRNVNNQNEFSHQFFRKGEEELLSNILRRNGTQERNCKANRHRDHSEARELSLQYQILETDLNYLNSELNYSLQQCLNFQNSMAVLQDSNYHLFREISQIKDKSFKHNDLLNQLIIKLSQTNYEYRYQTMSQEQTRSNRGHETLQKDNSSKDETNGSSNDNYDLKKENQ